MCAAADSFDGSRVRQPFGVTALAVSPVLIAGVLCWQAPFWADQALFTVYARQLVHGAVLYRDVFDVKQPGVFYFFAAAGLTLGFDEAGVHLFELCYWIGFSLFVVRRLHRYFASRWSLNLIPLLTVTIYYAYAQVVDLTQIEILVAFPILLAWYFIDGATPGTTRGLACYAGAGLAAAAVVLLKYVYLVIVLVFVASAVAEAILSRVPLRVTARCIAAFSFALLAPLAIVTGYFAAHEQLHRIWWAYFEMAPAAQLFTPRSVFDLKLGARRFMIGHAPTLILAAIGSVYGLKCRRERRFHLTIAMLLWVGSGAVVFWLQNWALYKWLIFTVPLGILAAVGVDALIAQPPSVSVGAGSLGAGGLAVGALLVGTQAPEIETRLLLSVLVGAASGTAVVWFRSRDGAQRWLFRATSAALAVSAGLAAISPAGKLRLLAKHHFAMTCADRTALLHAWYHRYRAADDDLERLRRSRTPVDAIYVFGDPVLLLRAGRPQAIPIAGWVPEMLDARGWTELYADLEARLPSHIVVDSYTEQAIRTYCPKILDLLKRRYEIGFVGASGTWYSLLDSPPVR
jgi:hypothetical protein